MELTIFLSSVIPTWWKCELAMEDNNAGIHFV
jgi:hypothetical protein